MCPSSKLKKGDRVEIDITVDKTTTTHKATVVTAIGRAGKIQLEDGRQCVVFLSSLRKC